MCNPFLCIPLSERVCVSQGVVLAFISLCCCFWSVCCKICQSTCCKCCNCCQDDDKALDERSKSPRCKVYFAILWGAITIAAIVGIVGIAMVRSGVNGFLSDVQNTIDSIKQNIDDMDQ